MKRKHLYIILFPVFISCACVSDGWKVLDLNAFKISIPQNWNFKKLQGVDSFMGQIMGPNVLINFDFSNMGYANSLLPTEKEYLDEREWDRESHFMKSGVTYTADFNVKNEKIAQMKKLGTTDSTLVHVEADPSYQIKTNIHLPTYPQKIKFPKADYIADLTFKDSTINVPIEIPLAIKSHHVQIDTTEKYIIKTIWPKVAGVGVTGIYIKSRSSAKNMQMNGINLSKENQQLASQAFKSITIK